MDFEQLIEERKIFWLKQNSLKSQFLSYNVESLSPEIGRYITVEGLQISENFFKEEFNQISESYFSVIKKLDEYYKNSKQLK